MMNTDVPISLTLAVLAERFGIDLASIAEDALSERVLRDVVGKVTARMRTALLSSSELSGEFGHSHIGCEHVFLAILADQNSLPSQVMERLGWRTDVIDEIGQIMRSDLYNKREGTDDSEEPLTSSK
jgi:ClpA/ClpB-like protein